MQLPRLSRDTVTNIDAMLDKIISFALRNRLLVIMAAILLIVGGLYVADTMEVDVFPDLNAPTVTVMTEAGGMAPEEVEKTVTFPIETALNGAADVRRVRSSSSTGFSVVWVEFDWGTDIYKARQTVSEKLSSISGQLPSGAGAPVLGPQSSILGEILIIGLTAGGDTGAEQLRTIADWTIRPALLATGGVAQASVLGGDVKEYQIILDLDRMRRYGISADDVLRATGDMNANASGGVLYEYSNEYIIRGMLATSSVDEIGLTAVGMSGDRPVLLRDIAEVRTGAKSPRTGLASVEGRPSVLITVTKQPDTSTKDLTAAVEKRLQSLESNIPGDVIVKTDIFRQSDFIDASLGNIHKALLEGALFVVIILFLFLMNVRTTLISVVTIPLSLLITIIVLRLTGLSINTMSIGGMAIAIGSLVDDAIVDVENVYKRLRENRLKPENKRLSVIEAVFQASREVRMPILNSTCIIVVSFIPLFFLSGIEGRMLIPLGIAFIVSLFASTLVALTLTPVLCSLLLGGTADKNDADRDKEPAIALWLKNVYGKCLDAALSARKPILICAVLMLAASAALFFTFGQSFLPSFNEGSFTINVSTLPGISLEESDRTGRRAEELILSVPEIRTVARKTGRAELDEHAIGVNTSEMEAPFVRGSRSKEEIIAELRTKLNTLPGVNVEIGQPISHRIDAMLSGTRSAIAVKIFGPDLNMLYSIGNEIREAVSGIGNLADLNVERLTERPELIIEPKREMLAAYGISPAELSEFIEVFIGGRTVSSVYEGGKVFDLTVKASESYRDKIETIDEMPIDTPFGKVPLGTVARVRSVSGPNTINRENASRKLVVSANVTDGDLQGAVNAMQRAINEKVVLPEGYSIEFGGQFESAQRASKTLGIATLLAILVIFLLLYNQFKSLKQSAIVLTDLPLALIGGVLTVFFTDGIISIPAIIGFISLFGIATRNGMLLIDRYNDLRAKGLSTDEAVRTGSIDRLNPILMTALTSALALIPLVAGSDLPGNEIQSPMAKVLLGGLVSSTLLNAFIIPIVYSLTSKDKI